MSNKLQNQKVIIAGGSSGIGLATAQLLYAQNAQITITGRDTTKLEKVKQEFPLINTVNLDSRNIHNLKDFFSRQEIFQHLVITVSGAKGGGPFQSLLLADLRE